MTVGELLGRISSLEITEWQVFFELQDEYLKRSQRKAEHEARGPQRKPSIGDSAGRADAITQARRAQGLDG